MTVKFTNNASTSVATGINTSATSLTVASASAFPQLSGADDYCYLTIQQATGTTREVVKATALSSNTFTIVRAQDNTTAGTWSSGDIVELRLTAALLQDVIDQATVEGIKTNFQYVPTAGQTQFSGADSSGDTMIINDSELVNVYMNGVRLVQGSDYTVSSTNNRITLTSGATTADIIDIEVFGNFTGQSGAAVAITGGAIAGTAITTGSINNTPIGATQANTVAATTLAANSLTTTGNATFGGALASEDITVTASSDSAHALSLQRASSSGRAQIRLLNESAAEIWRFGATGSGSSDFSFFDGGANVLVLKSSDDSAIFAGNVGIGAQSPDSLLELETAVTNATGGLLLTNTNASGYSTVQFRNTGGTAQTYTMALGGSSSAFAQKLYIYDDTDSAARVVLDHSGNLGIGTPSPDTTLDVQGAIQASESGGDFIRMQTDGSNNIFDINSGDYVFRTAGFAQKLRITTSGLDVTGRITATSNHSQLTLTDSDDSKFALVSYSGGKYIVRSNSTSTSVNQFTLTEDGKFGLGTINPNTNLQLYHATDDISLNVNHGTGGSYPKKSGISFGATSTSLGGDATFTGGAGIQVTNTAASNNPTEMGFFTTSGGAPTIRMLIDANGKLGISAGGSIFASRFSAGKPPNVTPGSVFTSSPSSFFSEATLGGTTGDSQKIAIFGGEDATNVSGLSIYRYRRATGTNWLTDGFSLRQEVDGSASLYDYINFAGGKVGIGTSTPDYQLDIENSSTHAMARLHAGANSSASLRLQNDAQHWDVNLQTNDKFAIYDQTSGSQPFTILPTTNYVGIGRADPTQLLEVHKNAGGDQTVAKFSAHNYGDTGKTFIEIGTEVGDGSSRIGSFNSTGNRSVIVNELHDGTSGVFKEAFRLAMDSSQRRVVRFRVADVANSDFQIISNDDGTSQAGIHLFGSDQNHSIFFRRGYDNTLNVMDFHQYGTFRFFNDGVLASQTKKAEIRPDGDFHVAYTGSADTSGCFFAGKDWGATNHRINRNLTQGNAVLVVSAYGGSGIHADTALFYAVSSGGGNSAGTALTLGKSSTNNRSINAGGTVNASGNDYAEYMEKKSTAFEIAAGDICGVNENGKLTNKFTEAHSFVVKSTDPSYVGGDIWGSEDVVGLKPLLTKQGYVNPEEEAPETDEEYAARKTKYETDLAAFEEALEAERIKYDRIAFSGQVPVNITGAKVGDYIVPKEKTGDLITAEAVTEPTFEQYQMAVGKVWKILEDGRAFISVKIG